MSEQAPPKTTWRPQRTQNDPPGYDPENKLTWQDYDFPTVPGTVEWKTPVGEPVITVDNLGIEFLRGRKRNLSLREIIFTGKSAHDRETFWALRDINFTVGRGEAVGLVGGNGGGKSTLLKLIAGTLLPDEGSASVTEGVAPLIELTGGFIGDLSARENIYLTAGLHGMSREQVDERFDEIVDFAGPAVRDGLDVPYRHFSSGMQVRLGFAVITCLDEPIILVDEVLAVGDAAFRNKCYTRMENLLDQGRTLFLVSHSEGDLLRFCTRGLYLKDGGLEMDGPMEDVVEKYMSDLMGKDHHKQSDAARDEARLKRQDSRVRRRLQRDAERAQKSAGASTDSTAAAKG
ncbi:ABC transporter ATP-binding protein [Yimella sp. RIT 621]|uniref:ABC-2 type transport system ATP-binding protein n=1 Tax=Yimella lutea TaxID=587872 RepID=A0A542EJN0_9MICO|nr:ABC transporter ATP-binding protein [Yimella sp. RIT 621]TQJ15532.1 ABC-2 type transport system ATP-binding protein [Yimella lutea]